MCLIARCTQDGFIPEAEYFKKAKDCMEVPNPLDQLTHGSKRRRKTTKLCARSANKVKTDCIMHIPENTGGRPKNWTPEKLYDLVSPLCRDTSKYSYTTDRPLPVGKYKN